MSDTMTMRVMNEVMLPTVRGMAEEGRPFKGMLYAGMMIDGDRINVLEFNCRFGDPETQAVLPRLKSDLFDIFMAMAEGDLSGQTIQWYPDAAVCVVVASKGYPGSYPKGYEISGIEMAEEDPNTVVFHAGTEGIDSS